MIELREIITITHPGFVDLFPVSFRLSQKGFDIHDDDEIIDSGIIINLQLLNNEYVENEHTDGECNNS